MTELTYSSSTITVDPGRYAVIPSKARDLHFLPRPLRKMLVYNNSKIALMRIPGITNRLNHNLRNFHITPGVCSIECIDHDRIERFACFLKDVFSSILGRKRPAIRPVAGH